MGIRAADAAANSRPARPAEAVPVAAACEVNCRHSLGPAVGGARVQAPRLRLLDVMASTPSAAWPAPAGRSRTSGGWYAHCSRAD